MNWLVEFVGMNGGPVTLITLVMFLALHNESLVSCHLPSKHAGSDLDQLGGIGQKHA